MFITSAFNLALYLNVYINTVNIIIIILFATRLMINFFVNVVQTSFNSYFACLVSALFINVWKVYMSTQHLTIMLSSLVYLRDLIQTFLRVFPTCNMNATIDHSYNFTGQFTLLFLQMLGLRYLYLKACPGFARHSNS